MIERLTQIAIIDSDTSFAGSTARLLEQHHYRCTNVHDLDSAERCLAENEFDLVLADLSTVGQTKLDFVAALRVSQPSTPVIVITDSPSLETAVGALHLSVFGYVTKPLNVVEFLRIVGRAIEYRKSILGMRELNERYQKLLSEMQHLAKAAPSSGAIEPPAHSGSTESGAVPVDATLLSSPEHEKYRALLRETLLVLEKTKRAFKSKDLGLLRKRIEEFLAKTP